MNNSFDIIENFFEVSIERHFVAALQVSFLNSKSKGDVLIWLEADFVVLSFVRM